MTQWDLQILEESHHGRGSFRSILKFYANIKDNCDNFLTMQKKKNNGLEVILD